jgi:hypothetical protein
MAAPAQGYPFQLHNLLPHLHAGDVSQLFRRLAVPRHFSTELKGRIGGILVACRDSDDSVPIVRTTTSYPKAPSPFSALHRRLIDGIRAALGTPAIAFNNAMIELYTHVYRTMGFHSDQALDLKEDSVICLLSCYNQPETQSTRTLIVQNKKTGDVVRLSLAHGSIVVFDTRANEQHVHKIVLEKQHGDVADKSTEWLGVTFRCSKSFVKDGMLLASPNDASGAAIPLRLASAEERMQFMKLKAKENAQDGTTGSDASGVRMLDYTLSPGDLLAVSSVKDDAGEEAEEAEG